MCSVPARLWKKSHGRSGRPHPRRAACTPGQHEERLLLRLSVVEAVRLARLQDMESDAELRELKLLALEVALRPGRRSCAILRRPPLGVPHVHDEPTGGSGREPGAESRTRPSGTPVYTSACPPMPTPVRSRAAGRSELSTALRGLSPNVPRGGAPRCGRRPGHRCERCANCPASSQLSARSSWAACTAPVSKPAVDGFEKRLGDGVHGDGPSLTSRTTLAWWRGR